MKLKIGKRVFDISYHRNFISILIGTMLVIRLINLLPLYIFNNHIEVINPIINDSYHHYHLGIFLILSSFLLSKKIKQYILFGIGLGMILEELPIVLKDLHLIVKNYYLTGYDFVVSLLLIIFSYQVFLFLFDNDPINSNN